MPVRITRLLLAVLLALGGLGLTTAAPPAAAAGTTDPGFALKSTQNPSATGELVMLTATADPSATGTVTFKVDDITVGTDALDNGTASVSVLIAPVGEHEVQADYPGDTTYAAASVSRAQFVETTITRRTWVGPTGGTWSTGANWTPTGPPENGDTLLFNAGGFTSTNDVAGLTIANLSFVGTTHQILAGGQGFTLSGDVYVASSSAQGAVMVPVTLPSGTHGIDGDIALGGKVSGAGGLKKTGPHTASLLAADNDYTGATEVAGGVLAVKPSALGAASSGTTVAAGATLRSAFEAGTMAEPLTLAGSGASATSGALDVQAATTFTGAVAVSGSTVVFSGTGGTLSGAITGGSTTLRKIGVGAMTLNAANTLGGVDVAAGTLNVTAGGGLGANDVTLAASTILSLAGAGSGTRVFGNDITAAAGATIATTGAGTVGLTGAIEAAGATTFDTDTPLNIAGVLSGAGALTKTGPADLLLTGDDANTNTGLFSVGEGELWAEKSGGAVALPAGVSMLTGTAMTAVTEDNQVGDAAPVTVGINGTLDLFGHSDVVGSLWAEGDLFLGILDSGGNRFSNVQTGAFSVVPNGSLNVAVSPAAADKITATSVTLGGSLVVDGTLARGTSMTLIDNTGADPVSGTFSGLAEGATVQVGPVPAVISYKGGTGNDVTLTVPLARSGYWMVDSRGKVYPFGDAKHYGEPSIVSTTSAVDIEPAPDFNGYWVLTDRGDVFAYGSAVFQGNTLGGVMGNSSVKATSISGNGKGGYWVFTNTGRVFPFGSAGHFKDMSGVPLNGPVLGSVGTPSGQGYYMVASDGGIFAFGDAKYRGSMGGKPLNGPVVGLAPDSDNDGYWLVGTDGGIFSFFAPFRLSMGGKPLNKPMIGMVGYGNGYLMVASDGGIFNFSDKPFKGSLGGQSIPSPITSVAPLNEV